MSSPPRHAAPRRCCRPRGPVRDAVSPRHRFCDGSFQPDADGSADLRHHGLILGAPILTKIPDGGCSLKARRSVVQAALEARHETLTNRRDGHRFRAAPTGAPERL